MKRYLLALIVAVAGVLVHQSAVSALTTTQYTNKPVMVTVTVTPSPAPVGYAPAQPAAQVASAAFAPPAAHLPGLDFARFLTQPDDLTGLFGADALAPKQLAQVQSAPGGNVPVSVNVKPDPTAAYLHITPVTPNLNAGYGANTFTCVYRVFGYFTKSWKIDDWVYGTTSTGGSAGFPGNGYPTVSAASWSAEGISTAYTAFANAGQPGELTFTGAANVSQDVCIDLKINVANSIPPGTYALPVTYSLFVTF